MILKYGPYALDTSGKISRMAEATLQVVVITRAELQLAVKQAVTEALNERFPPRPDLGGKGILSPEQWEAIQAGLAATEPPPPAH